jgi:hypothetical protein
MIRKVFFGLVVGVGLATQSFAFDQPGFQRSLEELSQGISQTAYALEERANTAERDTYEAAVTNTEKARGELARQVADIETADDLKQALNAVSSFHGDDPLKKQTAATALEMLKTRASFIRGSEAVVPEEVKAALQGVTELNIQKATHGSQVLSRTQKRLITVQVPVVEAALYLDDNKEKRRVTALEELFSRHGVRMLANMKDESGEKPQYNYYIAGKKFVVETLIRNFKGTLVNSDLKAVLLVTSGGFWGQSSAEFSIEPKRDAPEKGSLGWYQAVLEKDPFKYLAEHEYAKLAQLGKVEELAGERKLRLKNAKVQLWVIALNGTRRDAVYTTSVDFGDVYVAAR